MKREFSQIGWFWIFKLHALISSESLTLSCTAGCVCSSLEEKRVAKPRVVHSPATALDCAPPSHWMQRGLPRRLRGNNSDKEWKTFHFWRGTCKAFGSASYKGPTGPLCFFWSRLLDVKAFGSHYHQSRDGHHVFNIKSHRYRRSLYKGNIAVVLCQNVPHLSPFSHPLPIPHPLCPSLSLCVFFVFSHNFSFSLLK